MMPAFPNTAYDPLANNHVLYTEKQHRSSVFESIFKHDIFGVSYLSIISYHTTFCSKMFPSSALFFLSTAFAFATLGSVASAIPTPGAPSILSFRTRVNATGTRRIIDADRARAATFKANGKIGKRASSVSVTGTKVSYTASIGVGSPATNYTLLIDTGSSNTWIGANKKYVKTSTSVSTGHSIEVEYGGGYADGTEYTDTVTISPSLVITNQSIGVVEKSADFGVGIDGILGIGPTDLTQGTVDGMSTVPTVTDNLLSQGKISTEVIGIYYAPYDPQDETNGELTFGRVDPSRYTGSIKYTNLTTTNPASMYWGVDESINYGNQEILSSAAGIVDTGTTMILLASDAFKKYKSATGAIMDENTGMLRITSAQYAALSNLDFEIGGNTFTLTPNAQVWPRVLNTEIGGKSDDIYLIVGDLGSNSGEGFDFVNGYSFLNRFYSVYDMTNQRVGLATTSQTNSTSN